MTKLVLALDVDKNRAIKLINSLEDCVDIYKVGHKIFDSSPEIIELLNKKKKKVILDLKYHDIPSVVSQALEKVTKKYKLFGLTLHISGGKQMLLSALKSLKKIPRPLIFGVTVLTSLNKQDLITLGIRRKVTSQVKSMATLARQCGLDGVVCSGHEIELVKRTCGKNFLTLVPGVQIDTTVELRADQKRKFYLSAAVKKGADFVVIGRQIYNSPDPENSAKLALNLL